MYQQSSVNNPRLKASASSHGYRCIASIKQKHIF